MDLSFDSKMRLSIDQSTKISRLSQVVRSTEGCIKKYVVNIGRKSAVARGVHRLLETETEVGVEVRNRKLWLFQSVDLVVSSMADSSSRSVKRCISFFAAVVVSNL